MTARPAPDHAPNPAVDRPEEVAPGVWRLVAPNPSPWTATGTNTYILDGPALLPRVGIMVGPRDPSDRFTYWPLRMAWALGGTREGPALVPGDPDRPVQYSDARDIADWTVSMLAAGRGTSIDVVVDGAEADALAAALRALVAGRFGEPS